MGNNGTFEERYNRLIDVIEETLSEYIANQDGERDVKITKAVAKKMNENDRSISNIFRFISGIGLGSYLKQRRLEIIFSSKLQGRYDTWEEAALTVYSEVSAFKNAFKGEYNISVSEAERNPASVQLTKPLYLDSVMKGGYTRMDYNTYINESDWNDLKNYEFYGSLYNIGYNQVSFALNYVKEHPVADLEYVLCVLAETYPDKAASRFTDVEAAGVDLVIRFAYTRERAELLAGNLAAEGFKDLSVIDSSYLRIMEVLLDFMEHEDDDFRYKYPTYADYLEVKKIFNKKGYTNYWDIYGAVICTEDSQTWQESVNQYLEFNPVPIEGKWSDEEYLEAALIFADVPLADVFGFVTEVYGKEKLLSIRSTYDELVFAAMYFEGLSEADAKAFISAGAPDEIEAFLEKDYSVRWKYNRLKEREEI